MVFVLCVVRVSLPEWSKGLRSGRNVFERVGSNPTADIFLRNEDKDKDSHNPRTCFAHSLIIYINIYHADAAS